jgi:hypothetical protein
VKRGPFYVEINAATEGDRDAMSEILVQTFNGGNNFSMPEVRMAAATPRPADLPLLPKRPSPVTSLLDSVRSVGK